MKSLIRIMRTRRVRRLPACTIGILASFLCAALSEAAVLTAGQAPAHSPQLLQPANSHSATSTNSTIKVSTDVRPELHTRIVKVETDTFVTNLQAAAGKSGEKFKHGLLKEYLESIQVDLSPPRNIFWNDREGTIMIRGTIEDLDKIQRAIAQLNTPQPQLRIMAKFIAVSETEEKNFWESHKPDIAPPSGVWTVHLKANEAQDLFKKWQSADASCLLNELTATTLSGRQCAVEVRDAVTSMNQGSITNVPSAGAKLDLFLIFSPNESTFDIAMTATLDQFLGFQESGLAGSKPEPYFQPHRWTLTAKVRTGDTLVFGGEPETAEPSVPGNQTKASKRVLVMVTPVVTDSVGVWHTRRSPEGAEDLLFNFWHPTDPPRRAR